MAHAAGAWPFKAALIWAFLICSATEAGRMEGRLSWGGVTMAAGVLELGPAAAGAAAAGMDGAEGPAGHTHPCCALRCLGTHTLAVLCVV
eukprot:389329-Pelagomonas_calceolata.AAC.7